MASTFGEAIPGGNPSTVHDQYKSIIAYLARQRWPNLGSNIDKAVNTTEATEPKLEFAKLIRKLEDAPAEIRLPDNFLPARHHKTPENRAQGFLEREAQELKDNLINRYNLCQSTVELLQQHVNVEGLALALLILSQLPGHAQTGAGVDHTQCTLAQCVALQSAPSGSNNGVHVCETQNCYNLTIREEEITTTDDTINLLFLPLKQGLEPDLTKYVKKEDFKRRPWTENSPTKFIAISYVWAQMHPITQCRLKKLMSRLTTLLPGYTSVPIWLDFFCIPQSDAFAEAKTRGLSMMPIAYERATWVLVVDDLLLRTSCRMSGTAIGMMILASQWMRRLWTLPEAVNATTDDIMESRLVFCLRDGLITFPKVFERIDNENWLLGGLVKAALEDLLLIPRSADIATKFKKLFAAMEFRGTSRLEDEAPCLAGILRPDGMRIEWPLQPNTGKEGAEARMRHLFGQVLTTFPLSIVFMEGVRLNGPRFSWLPNSLIAGDTQLRPQVSERYQTGDAARPYYQGSNFSQQHEPMASWVREGLTFPLRKGVIFSFDSTEELNFTRIYVKYQSRNPDLDNPDLYNPRVLNWSQIRLDQTHWENDLEKKNQGSAYGPDQGWRQLDQVRPNEQLLLVTDFNCERQGIILVISSWDDDLILAKFICRTYVTPNNFFKMRRGPKPEGDQIQPEGHGTISEILGVQHNRHTSTSTVSDRMPSRAPEMAEAIMRGEGDSVDHIRDISDGFIMRREDNGPWRGIISLEAYEIEDCTVIIVG